MICLALIIGGWGLALTFFVALYSTTKRLVERIEELSDEEDPSCRFGGSRLEHRDGDCPCH